MKSLSVSESNGDDGKVPTIIFNYGGTFCFWRRSNNERNNLQEFRH